VIMWILQRKNKKEKAWDKTSERAMVRIVAVGSAEECPVKCDGNNEEQVACMRG